MAGLLDKAKRYAQKNPGAVDKHLSKAGEQINRRTGGKHAGTISKIQQGARKFLGGGRSRGY